MPYTNPHVWENKTSILDKSKQVSDSQLKLSKK